ncbi:MAG: CHASE2 domain-containing protein, partial [Verrucomicrobiota bacterium]|nr:CHASE2 domain-containing protein [Verrucomicrobiota bacterium]
MKKLSPVVLVGLLLTALSVALFVPRLRPSFIQAVCNYAYDAFLKRTCEPSKSGQVVIVDLDEASLADPEFGQWPWSRDKLAQLTRRILDAGASVVGFDITFPEQDRTSPVVYRAKMRRDYRWDIPLEGLPPAHRDFDALFAEALQSGRTVLGGMMIPSTGGNLPINTPAHATYRNRVTLRRKPFTPDTVDIRDCLKQGQTIHMSIPVLHEAAETAFFNADPDADNIVRCNPLIYALGEFRIYCSLALEAVRLHLGVDGCVINYDERGVEHIRLNDLIVPADRHGRLVVNYRKMDENQETGLNSSFPSYSAANVLRGGVPTQALANKIVLVGASAVGLRDLKATPIASDFPGVQVHATMIDNILSGDMLRIPSWMDDVHMAAILLMGIVAYSGQSGHRFRDQTGQL